MPTPSAPHRVERVEVEARRDPFHHLERQVPLPCTRHCPCTCGGRRRRPPGIGRVRTGTGTSSRGASVPSTRSPGSRRAASRPSYAEGSPDFVPTRRLQRGRGRWRRCRATSRRGVASVRRHQAHSDPSYLPSRMRRLPILGPKSTVTTVPCRVEAESRICPSPNVSCRSVLPTSTPIACDTCESCEGTGGAVA